MKSNEKSVEVLNDLVRINNDRIEGYRRAAQETRSEDGDLRNVFRTMEQESEKLKQELVSEVSRHGGEPTEGTMASGKIYRAWMDMKAAITGGSRKAILDSCEFGEDAAKKVYTQAGESEDISPEVRQLVIRQKQTIVASHDRIKDLRNHQR